MPNKIDLAALLENLSPNGSPTSDVRIPERVYLTLPEASLFSGLPRTHIYNLIKEEKLPALKTGAGWRIRRKDLKELWWPCFRMVLKRRFAEAMPA